MTLKRRNERGEFSQAGSVPAWSRRACCPFREVFLEREDKHAVQGEPREENPQVMTIPRSAKVRSTARRAEQAPRRQREAIAEVGTAEVGGGMQGQRLNSESSRL